MNTGKKYDVVALGELLVDFIYYSESDSGNPVFEANPGGAPCNVLSMLTMLGRKTAFIGKVGRDMFGDMLTKAVEQQGIATECLIADSAVNTTLAFVHKLPDGDRDFSFYRNPGADMMLRADEVDEKLIGSAEIFHFGSLSLTDEPVRSATVKALDIAKKAGVIRSFDPNLREPLWKNLDEAHEQIAYGLKNCDILKISDNEIIWFTGKQDFDEGIRCLRKDYPDIRLICLSMGMDGSSAYYGDTKAFEAAFLNERTIETTGAGDTFCGCMLDSVLSHGLDGLTDDVLHEMLIRANAAASLVTTRKGALRVMPPAGEIKDYTESMRKN